MSYGMKLAISHKRWADNLRWREPVKGQQKQHKPKDGVDCLYGELGGGEQERKQRDVTRYCQRSESTEIPAVTERD